MEFAKTTTTRSDNSACISIMLMMIPNVYMYKTTRDLILRTGWIPKTDRRLLGMYIWANRHAS
jgi:hypothetical protein